MLPRVSARGISGKRTMPYKDNETRRLRKAERMADPVYSSLMKERDREYARKGLGKRRALYAFKMANDPGYVCKKREQERRWAQDNPLKAIEKRKRYRETHKEEKATYFRDRRRNDVKFSLNNRISRRMNAALKSRGGSKMRQHWESLAGYSVESLLLHIQSKLTKGMTMEDVLNGKVHIDHKIPVAAFNFESTRDLDFKRCFALENLQPLWAIDNIRKKDRLDKPFQPMLKMEV
jgi:hypothetical protein